MVNAHSYTCECVRDEKSTVITLLNRLLVSIVYCHVHNDCWKRIFEKVVIWSHRFYFYIFICHSLFFVKHIDSTPNSNGINLLLFRHSRFSCLTFYEHENSKHRKQCRRPSRCLWCLRSFFYSFVAFGEFSLLFHLDITRSILNYSLAALSQMAQIQIKICFAIKM